MHEKLKPSWAAPAAPRRYPDITAVHFVRQAGSTWHLDFSREDDSVAAGRFFASDADACPAIEWPWVEGFDPQPADWRAAGFVVFEIPSDSATVQKAAQALLSAFIRGGKALH
jgi:hypothetical protein